MTDTTRKDMVGCYGNEKMKTRIWTAWQRRAFDMKTHIRVSLYADRRGVQFLQEPFHTQTAW